MAIKRGRLRAGRSAGRARAQYFPDSRHLGSGRARVLDFPVPRTVFAHLPPFGLQTCAGRSACRVRAQHLPDSRHLGSGRARVLDFPLPRTVFARFPPFGLWACARLGFPVAAHSISPIPAIWAVDVRSCSRKHANVASQNSRPAEMPKAREDLRVISFR
jgi:hypothetical protein